MYVFCFCVIFICTTKINTVVEIVRRQSMLVVHQCQTSIVVSVGRSGKEFGSHAK